MPCTSHTENCEMHYILGSKNTKNKHGTESISSSHENKESELLSKYKNEAKARNNKGK